MKTLSYTGMNLFFSLSQLNSFQVSNNIWFLGIFAPSARRSPKFGAQQAQFGAQLAQFGAPLAPKTAMTWAIAAP